MNLALEPVRLAIGPGEDDGRLVLADGRLVAVLVHLSGGYYDELAGRWYLEAGFGPLGRWEHPTFADLEAAQDWIKRRLSRAAERRSGTALH